jgi:hypothetical protein
MTAEKVPRKCHRRTLVWAHQDSKLVVPSEPSRVPDGQRGGDGPVRLSVPRSFLLLRHVDVSGVSGIGPVAEGTEWTDGSASLRWRGEHASTAFFETGVRAILAVHGHSGSSEILYSDGAVPLDRSLSDFEYPLSTGQRVQTASSDGLCRRCGGAWPCLRCPDLLRGAIS